MLWVPSKTDTEGTLKDWGGQGVSPDFSSPLRRRPSPKVRFLRGRRSPKFGCFIRMVIDKTAATTEAVPRPKTAFEHQENKVSRSGCFQPMLGLGAHNNVAITTQCSDMHFTSSTVLLFSQTEVRGDEDDAAFGVLELW
ncbi:hypothetical protein Bbelb_427790 [Branchiostoma belcheri]|nr:hypothetical protein Bbelb_427790 [Branchiostoma belcheri]